MTVPVPRTATEVAVALTTGMESHEFWLDHHYGLQHPDKWASITIESERGARDFYVTARVTFLCEVPLSSSLVTELVSQYDWVVRTANGEEVTRSEFISNSLHGRTWLTARLQITNPDVVYKYSVEEKVPDS